MGRLPWRRRPLSPASRQTPHRSPGEAQFYTSVSRCQPGPSPSVHLLPGQGEGGAEGDHSWGEGGGEQCQDGASVCFGRSSSCCEGGRWKSNEGGRECNIEGENPGCKTKIRFCLPSASPSSSTSGRNQVIFSQQSESQKMCYEIVTRAKTVRDWKALCSDSQIKTSKILFTKSSKASRLSNSQQSYIKMQIYINLLDFARAQVMQVTIVSHLHSVCHSQEIYLSPSPGKWAFLCFWE